MTALRDSETLLAMRSPMHRLIAIAILLGWLAPSISALGVGLHVLSEHHGPHGIEPHGAHGVEPHGPHGIEHQQEVADLMRIATHGHHHELDTADHDHDAWLGGQAPVRLGGLSLLAVFPARLSVPSSLAECSMLDRPRRRGPPIPLFTTHCTLLL